MTCFKPELKSVVLQRQCELHKPDKRGLATARVAVPETFGGVGTYNEWKKLKASRGREWYYEQRRGGET